MMEMAGGRVGGWFTRAVATIIMVVAGALGAVPSLGRAQDAPRPGDVATLDGILKAYYEVVSGPAGSAPDRARDRSLHHPDALVAIAGDGGAGRPSLTSMTLDGYHDRFGGVRQAPFYEWETARDVHSRGSITHVWSSYASSDRPGGPVQAEGVNSIQLHHDGERWWILSWMFDGRGMRTEGPASVTSLSPDTGVDDAHAVLAAVQEFFDAMEAADVARSRAVLARGAVFYSVRDVGGEKVTSSFTAEEHLARLPTSGVLLERMWDPRVQIDGAVATVFTPYDFHRDGAFSHCGTDAFTLMREGEAWIVTGATYTVQTEGCGANPAGPPILPGPVYPLDVSQRLLR